MTLDLGQHHLAHLGQHFLVRPPRIADKMQERLVLRRRSLRCRDRRHRLDALALARQHQADAIVAQWPGTIRMTNHTNKPLDISRKPRFTVVCCSEIHLCPQ